MKLKLFPFLEAQGKKVKAKKLKSIGIARKTWILLKNKSFNSNNKKK